jgi:hypothetical protein
MMRTLHPQSLSQPRRDPVNIVPDDLEFNPQTEDIDGIPKSASGDLFQPLIEDQPCGCDNDPEIPSGLSSFMDLMGKEVIQQKSTF